VLDEDSAGDSVTLFVTVCVDDVPMEVVMDNVTVADNARVGDKDMDWDMLQDVLEVKGADSVWLCDELDVGDQLTVLDMVNETVFEPVLDDVRPVVTVPLNDAERLREADGVDGSVMDTDDEDEALTDEVCVHDPEAEGDLETSAVCDSDTDRVCVADDDADAAPVCDVDTVADDVIEGDTVMSRVLVIERLLDAVVEAGTLCVWDCEEVMEYDGDREEINVAD